MESEKTETNYLQQLRMWAIWTAAVLAFSIANALVGKWIGSGVQLPPVPPPQIVVISPDGAPINVTTIPCQK